MYYLQMVQAFTGAPATLEVEKGGRISLMNGHVTGGFIELVSCTESTSTANLKHVKSVFSNLAIIKVCSSVILQPYG